MVGRDHKIHLVPSPLPWAETPPTRPGCSRPHRMIGIGRDLPWLLSHLSFFSRFGSKTSLVAGISLSWYHDSDTTAQQKHEKRTLDAPLLHTWQHLDMHTGNLNIWWLQHYCCIIWRHFYPEMMLLLPSFPTAGLREVGKNTAAEQSHGDESHSFLPVQVPELSQTLKLHFKAQQPQELESPCCRAKPGDKPCMQSKRSKTR